MKWYNPIVWVLLPIDLLVLLKSWFWHKRQSKKSNRKRLHTEIFFSLQSAQNLKRTDNLTAYQEQEIEKIEDRLQNISEELNLQSDNLDRYIENDTE